MTTAEILLKAADLIEPEGAWVQRHGDLMTCWCASTAIGYVCGLGSNTAISEWISANERVANFLRLPVDRSALADRIVLWNDAPGRTQAEVVAALRAAAKSVGAES